MKTCAHKIMHTTQILGILINNHISSCICPVWVITTKYSSKLTIQRQNVYLAQLWGPSWLSFHAKNVGIGGKSLSKSQKGWGWGLTVPTNCIPPWPKTPPPSLHHNPPPQKIKAPTLEPLVVGWEQTSELYQHLSNRSHTTIDPLLPLAMTHPYFCCQRLIKQT